MRNVSTCGQRLRAAMRIIDGLESVTGVANELKFSDSAVSNWANVYKLHGAKHPFFGYGQEKYQNMAKVRINVNNTQHDTSSDVPLSEILNQLGQQVNALQHTVFEAQARFEEAFKMIK